jgi:hypothetical protein
MSVNDSAQRFLAWCAFGQGDCPLSGGELLGLIDGTPINLEGVRRPLLRAARAAFATGTTAVDPALRSRLNVMREDLARAYLDAEDAPLGSRLDEALNVLLEALPFDDLYRPQTLFLAGEIHEQRGRQLAHREDLATAGRYFADAWNRSPTLTVAARRATLVWARLGEGDVVPLNARFRASLESAIRHASMRIVETVDPARPPGSDADAGRDWDSAV